jgi:hypothetical protein
MIISSWLGNAEGVELHLLADGFGGSADVLDEVGFPKTALAQLADPAVFVLTVFG